jgi:hypothetical protein
MLISSSTLLICHIDTILIDHDFLYKFFFDFLHGHIRGKEELEILLIMEIVIFLFSTFIKDGMFKSLVNCHAFSGVEKEGFV